MKWRMSEIECAHTQTAPRYRARFFSVDFIAGLTQIERTIFNKFNATVSALKKPEVRLSCVRAGFNSDYIKDPSMFKSDPFFRLFHNWFLSAIEGKNRPPWEQSPMIRGWIFCAPIDAAPPFDSLWTNAEAKIRFKALFTKTEAPKLSSDGAIQSSEALCRCDSSIGSPLPVRFKHRSQFADLNAYWIISSHAYDMQRQLGAAGVLQPSAPPRRSL